MRTTIIAQKGRMVLQPDKHIVLFKLMNGTIHQVDVNQGSANAIKFGVYNLRLDLASKAKLVSHGAKDEEEMNLGELRQYLKNAKNKDAQYYLTLMEWHKKFSLPSACIMLAILGVPLGIQVRVSKRSFGIGLGLGFFLLYYLMLSAGWVFGEAGVYPPVIGMWAPNIVTLVIGLILLNRAAKEKTMPWPSWMRIRSLFPGGAGSLNRGDHGRTPS
jgi:lipopolysaccharide export system permease protein